MADAVKFLGVCLDNALTWEYHVLELYRKLPGKICYVGLSMKLVMMSRLHILELLIAYLAIQYWLRVTPVTGKKYFYCNINGNRQRRLYG